MQSKVVFHSDIPVEALGEGVSRRVLAYLPEQMIVEVTFAKGAIGALHSHPHVQSTYVVKGEFVFTIENEEYTVQAGDTLVFASHESHGCVCRQAGVLIDAFTPMRKDFVKQHQK